MKKFFLIIIVLGLSLVSFGQNHLSGSGNVGIGTGNGPGGAHAPLHIKSDSDPILILQTKDNKFLYSLWKKSNDRIIAKLGFNKDLSNFKLVLKNGANRFTIPNGNVGVGTINPLGKLHIGDDTGAGTIFENRITSMTSKIPAQIGWAESSLGGGLAGDLIIAPRTDVAASTRFYTKDVNGVNERMRISGNGNVGIGTTNPEVKLDVRQSSPDGVINKIGMATRMSTVTSTDVASYDTSFFGSVLGFGIAEDKTDSGYKVAVNASAFSAYNNFAGTLNVNYGLFARAGIRVSAPNAKINHAAAVYAELLTSAANATITNGYGVKINTNGTGATNVINRYDLYAGTATAKNYFAGKVGIGTSTPAHKLDVNLTSETNFKTYDYGSEVKVETSGGWARSNRFTNGTQNSKTVAFGVESGNAFIATGFDSSTDQTGYQNQKLSILGNGNVGIGATTPDAKLTIKNGTQLVNFLVNKKLTGTWPPVAENATVTMQSSGTIAGNLAFATGNAERMRIANNGNVGIGTTNPGAYKLAVKGKIHTQEVKVDMIGWSDFVFEKDYSLPTLKEVAQHIQEKGHLKDIPSAKEVAKNGIFLGEMDAKLLQKIEELTLYTLEQEEKIQQLEKQNATLTDLSEKMLVLQARLEKIEAAKK